VVKAAEVCGIFYVNLMVALNNLVRMEGDGEELRGLDF
jgi:hypothetical protein